ncbi:hypothetical protein Goklo_012393 [Gossypium klotzschianum]|uniref:Bromo domain-containing protein n=1 Tax=Gossypium klotzschianum TaxID=34286 RepID=A0A7J8VCU3_9ROSI|nr:hypothetical protein [Gossypium klotzschianum]
MDIATLLQRVDSGQYLTCSSFLQDVDLVVANAKAYNGDDYNGSRIVSRAYELRDSVHGMLSQMDPSLVAYCDKIAAQGGPANMPDGIGVSSLPSVPVVQQGTITRASARLRNVQPEANLQSYEALKWPKKNADTALSEDKLRNVDSIQTKLASQTLEANENCERPESSFGDGNQQETCTEWCDVIDGSGSMEARMSGGEFSKQVETVKQLFVERTENYGIPELERLYSRIMKGIFESRKKGVGDDPKPSILKFLIQFAEDEANF